MSEPTIESQFWQDLQALKDKYRMCYIETWVPNDFETPRDETVGDQPCDWSDPKHVQTVNVLERRFDAEHGTNWQRIWDAVEESK